MGKIRSHQLSGKPFQGARNTAIQECHSNTQCVVDPCTTGAFYTLTATGSVQWHHPYKKEAREFPGIKARQISLGARSTLWAIQESGRLARWNSTLGGWEVFTQQHEYIVADPDNSKAYFYIDPYGGVFWTQLGSGHTVPFHDMNAKQIAIGLSGRLWALHENDIWACWNYKEARWEAIADAFDEPLPSPSSISLVIK